MTDEPIDPQGGDGTGTGTAEVDRNPLDTTDFRAFLKVRTTGEAPPPEDPQLPAAAETGAHASDPPARTAPDSGTDDRQQVSDEETPDAGEDGTRRPGTRERKIEKLTRENYDLQRRIEELEKRPPPSAPAPGTQPETVAAEAPGEPQLKDFKTLQEYQKALTKWYLDQEMTVRDQRAAQEKAVSDWNAKEEAAIKVYPDYVEVTQSIKPPKTEAVPTMIAAINADPRGGEILYQLAKNPAELERIAKLPPVMAAMEIGKLSAKLSAAPAPPNGKPQISGAPRPVTAPSRPAGNTQQDSIHDERVQADFPRWAKARMKEAQK